MTNSFLLILVQTTNSWRFTENVLNTTTESESEIKKRIFFAFTFIYLKKDIYRTAAGNTVYISNYCSFAVKFCKPKGIHFNRLCGLSKF